MSRRCAACQHPDVRDIDAQMVEGGASLRVLSRKYLVSEDSLQRHRKNHLPKIAVAEATESRETGHHRKLAILEKVLFSVLTRRLKDQDDGMVLRTHASILKHFSFELQLAEIEEIKTQIEDLRREIERREIER